jgi:uncharacterized protein with HEPN domain
MREKLRDKNRLEHIIEAIDDIFEFTNEISFEEYQSNKMLRFAVVKNLEIIGEASYSLTNDFRDSHTEVEWRKIITMRHILVHGYHQVEDNIIWDTIRMDLQPLKEKIIKFLNEEEIM